MRSFALLLVVLVTVARAQIFRPTFGRFPCTIVNGDGTFSADQNQCQNKNLIAPGTGLGGTGNQGDGLTPINPECVQEPGTGAYACGIGGATCSSDANCDNGKCVGGVCIGAFGTKCDGTDSKCLGFLYCTAGDSSKTASDTCGGFGSFCQDYAMVPPGTSDIVAAALFDLTCASGYCNFGTAECDVRKGLGQDCSTDTMFGCASGLICDAGTGKCRALSASARARARRNREKRSVEEDNEEDTAPLCPGGYTACPIDSSSSPSSSSALLSADNAAPTAPSLGAYECIDTLTSLEHCGACSLHGGTDCTSLPGVAAVGCVKGLCEVWACEDGWEVDGGGCAKKEEKEGGGGKGGHGKAKGGRRERKPHGGRK
ncbi:hypothetical protein JCM10908_004534 [Rhodotorula pacifica]|uniref:uncharacterized protein n=1 Tax=Rhodotorula pacifica TaxID=1495444 RepID=UPI00317BF77E